MKKILEVLECSNGELKFNTDVDVIKDPESIIDITGRASRNAGKFRHFLWGSCNKLTLVHSF